MRIKCILLLLPLIIIIIIIIIIILDKLLLCGFPHTLNRLA
jgi:hypothetical protein